MMCINGCRRIHHDTNAVLSINNVINEYPSDATEPLANNNWPKFFDYYSHQSRSCMRRFRICDFGKVSLQNVYIKRLFGAISTAMSFSFMICVSIINVYKLKYIAVHIERLGYDIPAIVSVAANNLLQRSFILFLGFAIYLHNYHRNIF